MFPSENLPVRLLCRERGMLYRTHVKANTVQQQAFKRMF
jgi:hypothetical protein